MERIQSSEGQGHSLPGEGIGRDKSGHGKNPTKRGALTSWRRHREGQVRTWKESDRERGTHILETASERTCQDMERIRPREGYSQAEDRIEGEKSKHGKKKGKKSNIRHKC